VRGCSGQILRCLAASYLIPLPDVGQGTGKSDSLKRMGVGRFCFVLFFDSLHSALHFLVYSCFQGLRQNSMSVVPATLFLVNQTLE
jgi:hypothetical protein